ncbi:PTS sugar transporter subunit IIA [Planctomycetota bacterium]
MTLFDLIRGRLVLPSLSADDKTAAIAELVDFMISEGEVQTTQRGAVLDAAYDREQVRSTGIGYGVAIPHGVTDAVSEEVVAIGISRKGVPFDSVDSQPAHIVILILTPLSKALTRVRTLAAIARLVRDADTRRRLAQTASREAALQVLGSVS